MCLCRRYYPVTGLPHKRCNLIFVRQTVRSMKFVSTSISGVWIIQQDRHEDDRGWFARSWCESEFAAHGLEHRLSQCSISFNLRRGTLRGLHYQSPPHDEVKVVRCTRGRAYDVAVDLRKDSPTYMGWTAVELSEESGLALYIPKGCAHGFQTLEDQTEIFYSISTPYQPGHGRGIRWNDPFLKVSWPLPEIAFLSERDATYPDFVL